jgi:hypothetical protein
LFGFCLRKTKILSQLTGLLGCAENYFGVTSMNYCGFLLKLSVIEEPAPHNSVLEKDIISRGVGQSSYT